LQYGYHSGLQKLVRDLNHLYRREAALHRRDCEAEGFRWITADDAEQSVFAWLRFGETDDPPVAIICNFTPVPRSFYRIGLPCAGEWREILNSDATDYGGAGLGNMGGVLATDIAAHGLPASAEITVPPLATLYLRAGSG
ncbi:MAG: alpha amylase C-terminal domain-containing protein, partial [Acetobacteraceae bacterium]